MTFALACHRCEMGSGRRIRPEARRSAVKRYNSCGHSISTVTARLLLRSIHFCWWSAGRDALGTTGKMPALQSGCGR
jgi:hypothetical protein